MDVQTNLEDAPTETLDDGVIETPHDNEPTMVDDTYRFYEEVKDDLNVDWHGDDLEDTGDDHLMSWLVDVLQTLVVSASEAVAYSVNMVKSRRP